MKLIGCIIINILLFHSGFSRSRLNGRVLYQNSSNSAAQGVEVSALGANTAITASNGLYTALIKGSLTELETTLDITQRSLQNANISLGYAMEQLSESKRSRFWSKFGLLGGGIGIGLLTGLLLSK